MHRLFLVRLSDGRVWEGAEFTSGQVCVNHPGETYGPFTIAVSLDALLTDWEPGHPLHGAHIEQTAGG